MLLILYIILFTFVTQIKTEETLLKLENSTNICEKCNCLTHLNFFTLNCAKKDIKNTLSNWPNHENKTLRATFSYNTIQRLEKFPTTNCSASIFLDHCEIKYLAPGLFENMKNINYLDLSYNSIEIEQLSSDKFKGPYNKDYFEPIEITYLNLAYNQIHSLPKSLFEHMPKLKFLNLEGNSFKLIDIQTQTALSSVPNLQHLNIAFNGIQSLPKDIFKNLKNLVKIDLSKNKFTLIPEMLAELSDLEVLILDSNPIYELNDGTFGALPRLIELSLNNITNLVEIHSNAFTPLKRLMKLHLSNNKDLEIFESDAFGTNNITLKEFYINNNDLIDIPSVLIDWSKLHIFEFNNNPLMCTCNLYKIKNELNNKIKQIKNGPYCIGEDEISYQVYSLDDRVCKEDYIANLSFKRIIKNKFSLIRVSLITISLVAITGAFIAFFVFFTKQKNYDFLRQNQFNRSSSVLYNPLNAPQPLS